MKREFFVILIFVLCLGFLTKKSGADFDVYYSAVKNFVVYKDISYSSLETYKTTEYNYMPVSLLMFLPFSCFSRDTANLIWFWINIFFIFTGIYLIWETIDGNKVWFLLVLLFLASFFYPVRYALLLGQVSVMIFFIYAIVYYLIQRDSDCVAGFLLSIPVILKVYPLIFLVFALIVKRRKIFFSMLVSVIFWILLSLIAFGIQVNLNYFKHLWYIWYYTMWDTYPNWISINAFISRIFGLGTGTSILNYAVILILFAISVLAALRVKKNQDVFFIFIVLSVLLSKFLQIHLLLCVIVPMIFLLNKFIREKKWNNLIWIFIVYMFMNVSDTSFMVSLFRNYFPKTDLFLHFLPLFGTILLWLILIKPEISGKKLLRFSICGLLVLSSGYLFARQGILFLKNGNKLEGDIVVTENGEYIFKKKKCSVVFQKKEIKKVKYTEKYKKEDKKKKKVNYDFDTIIHVYAEKYSLDPAFVKAIIEVESNFRQDDMSCKGAMGLMQLMPATADELNVDPKDIEENIEGGIRYLNLMFEKFGDSELALAGYNAGPAAVKKYGKKIPPYKETREYVNKVLKSYEKYKSDKQLWYFIDENGCIHFSDRPNDKRYKRISKK